MNFKVSDVPKILKDNVDSSWPKTIYNHYASPVDFMQDVIDHKGHSDASDTTKSQIADGITAYAAIDKLDLTYDKLYQEIALKVRDKLIGRGFTSKMLYQTAEFSTEKTGALSKQRALLGRKDCYFKDSTLTDGKLFHDMYINLSYSWGVPDSKIKENAYALYALTKELGRLLALRVVVVNHVGTDTPTCYSYVLKRFGIPIRPREFLFFLSDSKRTFGWATYDLLNGGDNYDSKVGSPADTVSIADFNLDNQIDSLWELYKQKA